MRESFIQTPAGKGQDSLTEILFLSDLMEQPRTKGSIDGGFASLELP